MTSKQFHFVAILSTCWSTLTQIFEHIGKTLIEKSDRVTIIDELIQTIRVIVPRTTKEYI